MTELQDRIDMLPRTVDALNVIPMIINLNGKGLFVLERDLCPFFKT